VLADRVVITITDYGGSFDPSAVPAPDLDALPEGGLGLFIIESFMDDVVYSPGPPNILRLTKLIETENEAEDAGKSSSRTVLIQDSRGDR
jgi:serine/threonine-protein kinase RsbW